MAGDWIKIEHALPDKPEVWRLAEALNISRDEVLGKLMRLWCWVDQQSTNGHDLTVTYVTVSALLNCAGFAEALESVGWLQLKNGVIVIPNFMRHNGETSKQRALTTSRVQRWRNAKRNDAGVTKRREEIYKSPLPTLSRGNGTRLAPGPAALKKKSRSKATPREAGTNPRAQGTNPRAARSNGNVVLSDHAIIALGTKLGLPARPGEEMDPYRARVLAEDRRRHND